MLTPYLQTLIFAACCAVIATVPPAVFDREYGSTKTMLLSLLYGVASTACLVALPHPVGLLLLAVALLQIAYYTLVRGL